jgi:uncharacterized caspase-like protein
MSFPQLKAWLASSVIMLGTAALVFGFSNSSLQAQQDSSRQLVQASEQRPVANRRIALVIGNGAYTSAPPLKNPPNDARDMAANLKTLGFDVSSGVNVSQREMKRLIREFGQKLKAGGSGLFYYAGHGVQARGRNYIIPVDAEIQSEADVEDSGVDVGLVLNYMDDAQNGLNIVILDACRNNPFSRSFRSATDGLAQVDAPTGTLIAYATAPGRVAADGAGENGLYTSELLRAMRLPGLSATDMFMQVRAEVMKKTGNKQVPWESSSLVGSFYFSGGAKEVSTNAGVDSLTSQPKFDAAAFEYNYWDSIKNSPSADSFKAYLAKYPEGQFADLAKIKIKNIEGIAKPAGAEQTASRGDTATEVAFWDYIKNGNKIEDFQAYLKKYPNGAFAELANNRVKDLDADRKEKEKADEAKRLEAEANKPIKTYDMDLLYKAFLYSHTFHGTLYFSRTKIFWAEDKAKVEEGIQKTDMSKTCEYFKAANQDRVEIRGIKDPYDANIRYRFKSPAEAAEALAEIQRICKQNP